MSWKDWLRRMSDFGAQGMEETGLPVFLVAMVTSLLSALFVSYLYVVFYESRATGSRIHRAFPLLGISITAIFITIQFSLPLSLGLLGALSIVRFRTPIKEPEEIAFIMVVVATSLCCATFNLLFLGLILAASVLALLIMRRLQGHRRPAAGRGVLVITLPEHVYREKGGALLGFLAEELPTGILDSVTEGHGQSSVSYRFTGLRTDRVTALQEGLREIAGQASASVYLDHAVAA